MRCTSPTAARARTRALLHGLLALSAGAAIAAEPMPAVMSPHTPPHAKAASSPAAKPQPTQRIDINSANRAQLKTLRGIGDAEADKIIANRPYLTSTEIVSKAGLPAGLYVAIKRQILAIPKSLPKVAKPAVKASS